MLVYRKSLFVSIFSFINTFCYTTENNNRFLSKPISSSKVEGAYEAQNQSALDIHEGHLEKSQIPPKPHENSSIEATNKFAEEAKEIELRKKSNKSPPIFEYNSSIKRISCNINFKNIPQFIIKEFEKWSLLMKEQKNGLVSEKVATKDAKKDKKILKKLFIRFGYFDVDIKTKIDFDSNKATIYYIAAPGERYKVSDKKIEFLNSTQNFSPIEHIIFVLRGEKIDFSKIESEQKKIQVYFKKIGYFFAEVKNPVLNIDHDAKSAEIVYSVDPGKIAIVSNIEISGEQKVPESLILKRIGLQLQSVLNASAIERAKINLTETGLFSNINIFASKGIETEKNQGTLLNVNVVEAPPRLVGAGVSYSASEGVLFQANWQHKNFLQKGHNIGTHLYLGQKELSSIIFLNIPDAFSVNQKLHFDVTLKHFDTKAYNGEKASATIGIIQSTQIKNNETEISFLPTFEHGTLKRKKKSYKQNIGGLKSNIKLNCSNHRLYPTKGIVFNIDLEQYFGQFGKIVLATESNLEKVDFNKKVNSLSVITGTISSYIPLSKKDEYEQNATILAAFIKIGGTVIKDLEYIPFDKRFYGGGRNSIRSYGYQMSGELESDGTPIGGASIIESCLESRFRISEDFGMVAFLDYSCITSEKTPSFYKENSCRYGYGFGVRYFTKFGPIRLDIGLPFTRRKDMNGKKIDKVIQFYVSVGQAF